MKKRFFYFLGVGMMLLTGCQKELSFEQGNNPGHATLQEEGTGDCMPKTVNGVYEVATPLVPGTNNITVDLDVTETGSYEITTDTVNGFYFRATGIFTSLGMNTITLRGNGTPFAAGVHNFVVSFDGNSCDIQITVLPAGAGGPAVFTLETTGTTPPLNCSGATAVGTYIIGSPLNSSNTVTLSVNVTTIGTYTIASTATNGMTFTRSDVFLNTGVQNVTLVGSGTPTGTPGPVLVPITVGTTTCNFTVTTVAGAEFSFDCGSAVVNGNYEEGVALDASNTVDIGVTVVTGGPYNISVTVNGMTFANSGTFTPGPTTITLTGTGTPAADGTFPVNMPGTAPCSFDVVVTAGATIDWEFSDGTTLYKGSTITSLYTVVMAPFINLAYTGMDPANNQMGFNLIDASGAISASENYSTVISAGNSAVWTFMLSGGDSYTTDATRNLNFTITSHNVADKTIIGTFSGTVKNNAGTSKTISGGKFTAVYQ